MEVGTSCWSYYSLTPRLCVINQHLLGANFCSCNMTSVNEIRTHIEMHTLQFLQHLFKNISFETTMALAHKRSRKHSSLERINDGTVYAPKIAVMIPSLF